MFPGAVAVALVGTVVVLAAGLVGPIELTARRALLVTALLAVVWSAPPERLPWRADLLVWLAPLLPWLAAPLLPDAGLSGDLVAALVVLALVRPRLVPAGRVAGDAGALVLLVYLAYLHVPVVWHAGDQLVAGISAGASVVAGGPRLAGPVHTGLWMAVYLALVAGGSALGGGDRRFAGGLLAAALALPVVVTAFGVGAGALLGDLLQGLLHPPAFYATESDQPHMQAGAVLAPWLQLIALALLAPLAALAAPRPGGGAPRDPGIKPRPGWPAAAGGALLALGAAVATYVPAPTAMPEAGVRIGFLDRQLDFTVPEPGRYGLQQAGMFGSTRTLLEQSGAEVVRVPPERMADGGLKDLDVLVVINLQENLADPVHEAIWRFVERGGGLLVMGDHTDLMGLMGPTNRLLAPTRVRFIFDSAFPLRTQFAHALEMRRHPITAGVRDNRDAQIGTGGSLVLDDPGIKPVVVGRYAFSDFGNRLNDGEGGLLGNYQHEHGERLGDVVLVAAADHGNGRVVVFGDTTSFQVLAVPKAAGFVSQTFAYLVGGGGPAFWQPALGGLILLAGIGLLVARDRWLGLPGAAACVAAGAALAALLTAPAAALPPAAADARRALIDVRHVPEMPLAFFTEGAMGGLFTAVQRAGYLPIADRAVGPERYAHYDMAVFMNPAHRLSRGDRAGLRALLARGGRVMVVAGWPRRAGAVDVLRLCGLALERVPLGPAEPTWRGETVQFVDAWPLTPLDGTDMTALASWHGRAIAAETRVGSGHCIALADTRFFQDRYFEGERDYHPVNVRFVDAVLSDRPQPVAEAKSE